MDSEIAAASHFYNMHYISESVSIAYEEDPSWANLPSTFKHTNGFSSNFILCAIFESRNSFIYRLLETVSHSEHILLVVQALERLLVILVRPLQQSILGANVHLGFPFESRRPQPSSISSDQICQNQPTPPWGVMPLNVSQELSRSWANAFAESTEAMALGLFGFHTFVLVGHPKRGTYK
jgi:hypothetical protein